MKRIENIGNTTLGFLLGLAAIILCGGAAYSMVKSQNMQLKGAGVSLQVVNRLQEISETNQQQKEVIDILKQNKAVSRKTINRLEGTIERNEANLKSTSNRLTENIDKLTNENHNQDLPGEI